MTPPPGAPRCGPTPKPAVAHEVGVPLVVDNTVATPYLIRPIEWETDVVVHSATKYIGLHGTAIGGVIIDSGRFDYGAHPERFPNYNQPDPSFHGKARVQLLRDLGSAVAPFNAWLIAQGLETLSLQIIHSLRGHDGFLVEGDQLAAIVAIALHREGGTSLDQI